MNDPDEFENLCPVFLFFILKNKLFVLLGVY